jgi:hypothetical protein
MALLLILALCAGSLSFAQPTVLQSFNASAGTASGSTPTYKDHPDMAGGVGPTEVVAFTGQEVLVQDKSGNIVSGWPKSQSTFWQTTVGVNPSSDCGQSFAANDPDLVYDSIDSRWYAVHSAPCDYLAVSSGSTFATSTWKYITFGNANGDLIMKAGYDKNGVYITYTNAAGSSSFCVRIPKADVLWSGGGNIVTTHIASNTTSGIDAYMRPTIDTNASKAAGDPTYFADLDHGQNASAASVNLWLRSATWSGTTSTLSSRTTVATGITYNMATSDGATQQGSATKLRVAATFRLFNVPFVNGSLWLAAVNMVSSIPAWNWWEVRASDFTILQEGAVSGSYGTWLPAVGADSSGHVMFAAARASSSEYMSIYTWYRSSTDTASTLSGPTLVLAGTQPYTCSASPVGTGNYVTSANDPSDPTKIWFLQEYAASATACLWQTRWIQMSMASSVSTGTRFSGGIVRGVGVIR